MADLVILAEEAPEITIGEEDRAGTAKTNELRLFAEMRAGAGDNHFRGRATDADLTLHAVGVTATRTEGAVGENGFELLRSLGEFAGSMESEVRRSRHNSTSLRGLLK